MFRLQWKYRWGHMCVYVSASDQSLKHPALCLNLTLWIWFTPVKWKLEEHFSSLTENSGVNRTWRYSCFHLRLSDIRHLLWIKKKKKWPCSKEIAQNLIHDLKLLHRAMPLGTSNLIEQIILFELIRFRRKLEAKNLLS